MSDLSRRKRIIVLLAELPHARSALKGPPPSGTDKIRGASDTGHRMLLEDGPLWQKYPFEQLERALNDLRSENKREFFNLWRVYCERVRPTAVQLRLAHMGLRKVESSPHLPEFIRVPSEARLVLGGRRASRYGDKRRQNAEIRSLVDAGYTHDEVAYKFGITRQRVGQIVREAA